MKKEKLACILSGLILAGSSINSYAAKNCETTFGPYYDSNGTVIGVVREVCSKTKYRMSGNPSTLMDIVLETNKQKKKKISSLITKSEKSKKPMSYGEARRKGLIPKKDIIPDPCAPQLVNGEMITPKIWENGRTTDCIGPNAPLYSQKTSDILQTSKTNYTKNNNTCSSSVVSGTIGGGAIGVSVGGDILWTLAGAMSGAVISWFGNDCKYDSKTLNGNSKKSPYNRIDDSN